MAMRIFRYIFISILFFVPCVSTAQKVRVVSEDEISIPYLYFVSFDKKRIFYLILREL